MKTQITTNIKIDSSEIIRLENCINGNPRYYVEYMKIHTLPEHLHHFIDMPRYKGKRYGSGYVLSSYNLDDDLGYYVERALHSFMTHYIKSAIEDKFETYLDEGMKTKFKSAKGYFRHHISTVKDYVIKSRGSVAACEDYLRGLS